MLAISSNFIVWSRCPPVADLQNVIAVVVPADVWAEKSAILNGGGKRFESSSHSSPQIIGSLGPILHIFFTSHDCVPIWKPINWDWTYE